MRRREDVMMVMMPMAWGCVVIGVALTLRGRRGTRRPPGVGSAGGSRSRSATTVRGVSVLVDMLRSRIAAGGRPDDVLSQTLGIPLGVRSGRARLEERLSTRLGAGEGLAVARRAAQGIDMASRLSARSGCPLSVCLDAVMEDMHRARTADALRGNALALPRATAGLLAALPLLVLAGGGLLGSQAVRFLVMTSAGRICLAVGGVLYALGVAWVVAILRSFDAETEDEAGGER